MSNRINFETNSIISESTYKSTNKLTLPSNTKDESKQNREESSNNSFTFFGSVLTTITLAIFLTFPIVSFITEKNSKLLFKLLFLYLKQNNRL
jgi:hypothetical protein